MNCCGDCVYVFIWALGNGNVCAFGVSRWRAEMQRHTHQAGPHESNLIRNLNKWQCIPYSLFTLHSSLSILFLLILLFVWERHRHRVGFRVLLSNKTPLFPFALFLYGFLHLAFIIKNIPFFFSNHFLGSLYIMCNLKLRFNSYLFCFKFLSKYYKILFFTKYLLSKFDSWIQG